MGPLELILICAGPRFVFCFYQLALIILKWNIFRVIHDTLLYVWFLKVLEINPIVACFSSFILCFIVKLQMDKIYLYFMAFELCPVLAVLNIVDITIFNGFCVGVLLLSCFRYLSNEVE